MDKIVKNLGGDRLGSGSKMEVQMHNYERSTHDLSRAWRSTMAPGTLIPFFQEIALNGDTWDIDLQAMVRTLPTVGPLFGSFKLQLDIFQCPLRLYNGILHNNATRIGMEMNKVIFPKVLLKGSHIDNTQLTDRQNSLKNANSSLAAYLGIRGIGAPATDAIYKAAEDGNFKTNVQRTFFADGLLSYWDIFKNYYANKQEEKAFYIANDWYFQDIDYIEIAQGYKSTPTTSAAYGRRISEGSSINRPVMVGGSKEVSFNVVARYTPEQMVQSPDETSEYAFTIKKGDTIVIHSSGTESLDDILLTVKTNTKAIKSVMLSAPVIKNYFDIDVIKTRGSESYKIIYLTYSRGKTTGPQIITNSDGEMGIYNVTRAKSPKYYNETLSLQSFPLENIDTMREQILATSAKNTLVIINETGVASNTTTDNAYKTNKSIGIAPYSGFCKTFMDSNNLILKTANQAELNGVAVKTYQSDIYNNWLNSEWIDGSGINNQGNSIQAITSISTADGSFTIDELILAKKVYDMLNRIAVSGGTYEDWQEAVYGEEAMKRAESPIYCGGMSQEIEFEEIVSSSESAINNEEKALGTLAGKGTLNPHTRKGGSITIKVKEPSLIMGIVSITPRIDYSQGNKWFNSLETMDDLHKPALDGIGFQDLIAEQMAWWTTIVKSNANNSLIKPSQITTQAIGKQPAWINYQTAVSEVYGEFADDSKQYMTLQRNYTPHGKNIADATTYIDPSKYNYAFANQELTSQNFWVNIGIKAIARRKMSAKLMPNL